MRNRRSHVLLSVAVSLILAACAFVLGKRVGAKRQAWCSAVEAHHTAVDHCQALGKEMNQRMQMAWRAKITLPEFGRNFGEPVPVNREIFPEAAEDDTHVLIHDASHRVFYLRFDNTVLAGHHSSHGADDIQPHLPSIEERLAAMR